MIFWRAARGRPDVGPLASRIGGSFGSDFSVFGGLLAGGAVYWLLTRRTVRAEGNATADPSSYDPPSPMAGTS